MRDEVSEGICDSVTVDVSISYEQHQVRCPLARNDAMVGPSPDDLSADSIELKAKRTKTASDSVVKCFGSYRAQVYRRKIAIEPFRLIRQLPSLSAQL
jgi:hypothetical protein